jgi:hypothetical protein
MEKIYKPLYPETGGPPLGFACGRCTDVVRTKKGVLLHLWLKHRVKLQLKIDLDAISEEELVKLDE